MHGRIKVRTTEEQKALRHKEQQKKLAAYRMGMKHILATRSEETYDPASLGLCSQLLLVNPDIYTLWNYRKEVILIEHKASKAEEVGDDEKLAAFLENELRLTEQCLVSNPKSYGSWHHRYWLFDYHPKPNWQRELDHVSRYLTMDDRNFHAWDYRRLVLQKVGLVLTKELEFSTDRININFSNYSSWHYRSTLQTLDERNVGFELALVQNAVFTDPADSSAWFYLRWVLSNPGLPQASREELLEALEQLQELEPDCKWILLAKCWLSGGLSLLDKAYVDNRIQYYRELVKLDPLRKGHYEDCLKSANVQEL